MPRSKIGKKRPPVDKENLKIAVEDVLLRHYSTCKAAENNRVAKTTLLRHLAIHRSTEADTFIYQSNIAHKQIFSEEEENLLVCYIKTAAKLHYGIPKKELQKLAYEFAFTNNKKIPNTWIAQKQGGKEWIRQFLSRHPDVSLRKPEPTSLARATAFNKNNVDEFFRNLKSVYDRYNFDPSNIYNLDETGNTTVHVPPKILAPKGQKQIGSVTSGERGVNVTMVVAINAVGNQVPPMLIFPRVHFKEHMLKGAPPGAIGAANPSGWINEHLFLKYLRHFISHVKSTVDNKVLLIFDNHVSHISVAAINLAKKNGVVLLTMPPHTSHKLQPLDRTVFGPYKTFYNQTSNQWLINNPGKPITIYDISEIVGAAYLRAFSMNNIVKGFSVTGICPYNENIFSEDEFLSSYVTDRPQLEKEPLNVADDEIEGETQGDVGNHPIINNREPELIEAKPSTSRENYEIVSPHVVRPFPKAGPRKERGKTRRKGKTRILTDTPVKVEIEKYKSTTSKKNVKKAKKKKVFCETSEDEIIENIQFDDSTSDDDPLISLI